MKNFKRALVVGEETIFGELVQIIDIAAEANVKLIGLLDNCKNPECIEVNTEEVKNLEKKSDEVTFKIKEDITAGAVSPNILNNLLEAVNIADDMVDTYYYVSRELNRMYHTKFPSFGEGEDAEWVTLFKSMLELAALALQKDRQILATSDLSEILRLRKEIEHLEQQGDEIKDHGFDKLYRQAQQMHYLQFYHYSELLHKFDDILDGCEDFSDIVLSTIISILK